MRPWMLAQILVLAWLVYCTPSVAHDWQILNCTRNIVYTQAELLTIFRIPNGLVAEGYDTNKDGEVDVYALSAPDEVADQEGRKITHHDPPIYYDVDRDYDGNFDYRFTFIGTRKEECDKIILTKEYIDPKAPWEDYDERSSGDTKL